MPLKTKTRIHDVSNLSVTNYHIDPNEQNEFSKDNTKKSIIQQKTQKSQVRQQSAPKTVPPNKKPEVPKGKKDDCLLF